MATEERKDNKKPFKGVSIAFGRLININLGYSRMARRYARRHARRCHINR